MAIRVEPEQSVEDYQLETLALRTVAPGDFATPAKIADLVDPHDKKVNVSELLNWLHSTMGVFYSAASSSDFFQRAAQSVAEIVDLDDGAALMWDGSTWKREALFSRQQESVKDWKPSNTILRRVREERCTFRGTPKQPLLTDSLRDVEAFVAAPILEPGGEVIGALYGDRRAQDHPSEKAGITELEAAMVELLASAVAAGLARIKQEEKAIAARVTFQQFFAPSLAERLESLPDLLKGRNTDVTVLFCDIRGFSRVNERLDAEPTIEWIGDVLGMLSECVMERGGVLVDYVGDELLAMWGAPDESPDHPEQACQAAIEMLQGLADIDDTWEEILGQKTRVGIGINSGPAFVGNVGSHLKFKYGALGNTVNLGSRIQGITKKVGCDILISEATDSRLSSDLASRKVCHVRVVNIEEPVALYELAPRQTEQWLELKNRYESSLDNFVDRKFADATRMLGEILAEHPDGPSLLLLSRSVNAMVHGGGEPNHPVWELDSK